MKKLSDAIAAVRLYDSLGDEVTAIPALDPSSRAVILDPVKGSCQSKRCGSRQWKVVNTTQGPRYVCASCKRSWKMKRVAVRAPGSQGIPRERQLNARAQLGRIFAELRHEPAPPEIPAHRWTDDLREWPRIVLFAVARSRPPRGTSRIYQVANALRMVAPQPEGSPLEHWPSDLVSALLSHASRAVERRLKAAGFMEG